MIVHAPSTPTSGRARTLHERHAAGLGQTLRRSLRRGIQPGRLAYLGRQVRRNSAMRTAPMAAGATSMKTNTGLIRSRALAVQPWQRRSRWDTPPAGSSFCCAVLITADVVAAISSGSAVIDVELTGYMLALGITWALATRWSSAAHVRIDILINRLPLRRASGCIWSAWRCSLFSPASSPTGHSTWFRNRCCSERQTSACCAAARHPAGTVGDRPRDVPLFIVLMLIVKTLLVLAGVGGKRKPS